MVNTIKIFDRASKDKVLSGKLSWVMSDFWRRSRGRMDQRYFDDLADDKVKIGYWDRARGKKYAAS